MTVDRTRHDHSSLPDRVVRDLLRVDRRRLALEILAQRREPIVVEDLAARIRAREVDTAVEELPAEERGAVRDEFFTEHLPKLTATGVVEYDSLLGTVVLTDELTERLCEEGETKRFSTEQ